MAIFFLLVVLLYIINNLFICITSVFKTAEKRESCLYTVKQFVDAWVFLISFENQPLLHTQVIKYYLRALLIHCFVLFFKLGIFVLSQKKSSSIRQSYGGTMRGSRFFWRGDGRGLRIIRVSWVWSIMWIEAIWILQ